MSASAISEIYDALAGLSISGVRVRNIDKAKIKVSASDLPVRILLPSTSGELSYVAIGTLNKVEWSVRDICLWAPLSSGRGIEQHADDMVDYIKAYVAALKTLRNPTPQSVITNVGFQMGPVPWAADDYWAVDTTLVIEEIM